MFDHEEQWEKINWNVTKVQVIKLHGSIENKEKLAVTLKRVSKQYYSQRSRKVLEYIFSAGPSKNVLVLGYTSSDVFDISPQIQSLEPNHKNIFYIQHPDPDPEDKSSKQKNPNPFEKYQEKRFIFDTDDLVKKVWNQIFHEEEYRKTEITKIPWKVQIDSWSQKMDEISRFFMVGQIFLKISEYARAEKYYKKGLQIWQPEGNRGGEGRLLGNLGIVSISLGDYENAKGYYEKALNIAQVIEDKEGEGVYLGNIGTVFRSLGNFTKAKDHYEKVLAIAKNIGNATGTVKTT